MCRAMRETQPNLEAQEKIERERIPGLMNVLREEGLEAVRYLLWDMTGWRADYDPASGASSRRPAQRSGPEPFAAPIPPL